jgi:hypothetical protein
MFNVFVQNQFYPISESELDEARESGDTERLVKMVDGSFDVYAYEQWLESNQDDIVKVTEKRRQTLEESDAVAQALFPPPPPRAIEAGNDEIDGALPRGVEVCAGVVGKC